jgi:hypothetical protein
MEGQKEGQLLGELDFFFFLNFFLDAFFSSAMARKR